MYITSSHLKGFDSYKYSCKDTSPLANYVMHPFWNQFVKIFPTWLAPNLMTFTGFMLLVIQYVILCCYDPVYNAVNPIEHTSTIPQWVWWFSFFAQFFSHTLDGCDGKQARRTKTSSPLGELFDHGIDSWCVSFFTLNAFSIFGKDSVGVEQFYFIQIGTMVAFVISHWEKYNTGILYLPWAYDLSQIVLALVYLITAIKGVETWMDGFMGLNYCLIFQIMTYGSVVLVTIPIALYNIYITYKQGECKQSGLYEGLLPLLSPTLLFVLTTCWVYSSPSNILQNHPRLITFLNSVVFSNIVARLIVAQMSNSRCERFNKMLPALFLAIIVSLLFPQAEVYVCTALVATFTLAHIHYGYVVVNKLAEHLNIKVFSIKSQID